MSYDYTLKRPEDIPPSTPDVGPGVEDGGAVKAVSRTLTSAEILGLNTSPVTLVAGEAGIVHWPVQGFAVMRAGATPYTIAGSYLILGSELSPFPIFAATVLQSAEDTLATTEAPGGEEVLSGPAGAALVIRADTGDPTLGDGTLEITILYHDVDVS